MDSQLLELLQAQLHVTFEEEITLEDDLGKKHPFYLANIREARVYFDVYGQIWMNEAEIARALGMSIQAVRNSISRLMHGDFDCLIEVHRLFSQTRKDKSRLINFYNEETIALIASRSNDLGENGRLFLMERQAIIKAVRHYFFQKNLAQQAEISQAEKTLKKTRQELEAIRTQYQHLILDQKKALPPLPQNITIPQDHHFRGRKGVKEIMAYLENLEQQFRLALDALQLCYEERHKLENMFTEVMRLQLND